MTECAKRVRRIRDIWQADKATTRLQIKVGFGIKKVKREVIREGQMNMKQLVNIYQLFLYV